MAELDRLWGAPWNVARRADAAFENAGVGPVQRVPVPVPHRSPPVVHGADGPARARSPKITRTMIQRLG